MKKASFSDEGTVFVGYESDTGRGIYANRRISQGAVVLILFSWELTPADLEGFQSLTIGGYWFEHPERNGYALLPIGLGELINHSPSPNADLTWEWKQQFGYVGTITALRQIAQDEQIRIDYGIETPANWRL